VVDLPWTNSRKIRAVTIYVLITLINSATWIWAVTIQNGYCKTDRNLDWGRQKRLGRGFGLFLIERLCLGMVENYIYCSISNLSDSPGDQFWYSSLLRGIEKAAVAVKLGVKAVPRVLIATASINFGILSSTLPFGYRATLQVVRKFNKLEREKHIEAAQ
jgi:hypothetical protein